MSTAVMAACWPLQMPYAAKSVLVSLADNANDHGECWPSIDTISKRTCLHRTSVIRAIASLEKMGHLSADRTNGRHTRYVVTPKLDLFGTSRAEQPVAQSNRLQRVSNQSHKATAPVAQSDTNRKEPKATVNKKYTDEFDFSSWPSIPEKQIFDDWLKVRKQKRLPLTATAMVQTGKQLRMAEGVGWNVDAALTECVTRGWAAVKLEWLQNATGQKNGNGNRNHESTAERASRFAREGDEAEERRTAQAVGTHGSDLRP